MKHCTFTRLDNNAIFLSGYNRHTRLTDNDFAWLGLSAMAAWGYTKESDGTDGQQPRFTSIERNYVREIGIIEKQSSMWFQAKAAQTTLYSNVAFNQPRAAINFNDGFGGGNNASRNLLFNTCRETGDHVSPPSSPYDSSHSPLLRGRCPLPASSTPLPSPCTLHGALPVTQGPINSWDRQPFFTDVATGSESIRQRRTSSSDACSAPQPGGVPRPSAFALRGRAELHARDERGGP